LDHYHKKATWVKTFDSSILTLQTGAQSSPSCFSTASFSVLSSSVVHSPLRAVVSSLLERKTLCHLLVNCCTVQPGTSSEIAAQSSPLCFSTASFSLTFSDSVHIPLRAVISSLLERKEIVPPTRTMLYPSTLNQRGNSSPRYLFQNSQTTVLVVYSEYCSLVRLVVLVPLVCICTRLR
jgi:hypothetical protein